MREAAHPASDRVDAMPKPPHLQTVRCWVVWEKYDGRWVFDGVHFDADDVDKYRGKKSFKVMRARIVPYKQRRKRKA